MTLKAEGIEGGVFGCKSENNWKDSAAPFDSLLKKRIF